MLLNRVTARTGRATASSPVGVKEFPARFVEALVGVRPKVIALGLNDVGAEASGAVAVKVRYRAREGWNPNAVPNGSSDHVAPSGLVCLHDLGKVRINQKVGEVWLRVKRSFDVLEERGANDATAAPHQGDAAKIEFPTALERHHSHQLIALGVRADFAGKQRLTDLFNESGFIPSKLEFGCGYDARGGDAFFF